MKTTNSNNQKRGSYSRGGNRNNNYSKPKYGKSTTTKSSYYGTPTSKSNYNSYQQDKYDNYGRPVSEVVEYGKCQNAANDLMMKGNKAHIKHFPTICYIKDVLKNNIQDPTAGFLHITERGLDGVSFDSMKEEFDVLHPNELKTNIQPFIDAIFSAFVTNGVFDKRNENNISIIKLLVREKNCLEKTFNYDKMALLASKYSVEYSNETLITIDAIKARMFNSLAESVFAIETELAKGPVDFKRDETRVNYIKVPIRSFLMEYATCCQEVLALVKPKRYRG